MEQDREGGETAQGEWGAHWVARLGLGNDRINCTSAANILKPFLDPIL